MILALQWGRRNYPAETRSAFRRGEGSRRSFNGAAGITRRKLVYGRSRIVHPLASMGPPELPGGNVPWLGRCLPAGSGASMGPPELPGGNAMYHAAIAAPYIAASMGPPELPGGNKQVDMENLVRNNSASMGPPELPGGNGRQGLTSSTDRSRASMGPPELPGGNLRHTISPNIGTLVLQWGRRNYPAETHRIPPRPPCLGIRFNGAAGITRRKLGGHDLP